MPCWPLHRRGTDRLLICPQMEVDAEEKRHRTRSKGVRGTCTRPRVPGRLSGLPTRCRAVGMAPADPCLDTALAGVLCGGGVLVVDGSLCLFPISLQFPWSQPYRSCSGECAVGRPCPHLRPCRQLRTLLPLKGSTVLLGSWRLVAARARPAALE